MAAVTREPTNANDDEVLWAAIDRLTGLLSNDLPRHEMNLVTRIRRQIPSYDALPDDVLLRGHRRNLAVVVRSVRERKVLATQEIPEADSATRERIAQGLKIEDLMAAFRISFASFQEEVVHLSADTGTDARAVLHLTSMLWQLGDIFSARVAHIYREHDVVRAVEIRERKNRWIISALNGEFADSELELAAGTHGIPKQFALRAMRMTSAGTEDKSMLLQRIHDANQASAPFVCAITEAGCVGIVWGDIVIPPRVTLALGSEGSLSNLASSFELAAKVLETAVSMGISGKVDSALLTWRMGVVACPDVTALLEEALLGCLNSEREFGISIKEALTAYLANNRNIPLAAKSIPVHVNTLRYRLQRYEKLSGRQLNETNTIIELSWALASIHRGPGGAV